jgi:hypothetical protein
MDNPTKEKLVITIAVLGAADFFLSFAMLAAKNWGGWAIAGTIGISVLALLAFFLWLFE